MLYKILLKPILFSLDAEFVHERMLFLGEMLGNWSFGKKIIKEIFYFKNTKLTQKIAGIKFENPIGLSAGYDYDAKLTQIISSVGFGYATVGTITNIPYEGNPRPRLARLPISKSILVNKGFKSIGADKVIKKLNRLSFDVPIGISIGRSNSPKLKNIKQSIDDIIDAFTKFEKAKIKNAYYELNVSCPNLIHGSSSITFYPSKNLDMLLTALDKLNISKPIFVKMPISESDKTFDSMLKVIVKHKIAGVIIGNLQKDRANPTFNKNEIKKAGKGNFSGIPCRARSNELIARTFKKYGNKLIIIGCGGVFDARDAYEKIKLGASLIMMITGLIYEGPQIVANINKKLVVELKKDGYKKISEAVGKYIF